ncbi:hypothetical protein [Bradyrhizobium sp. USDA 4454]
MGEIVRFVPKAERERIRLIQEARAIYDSIFPQDDQLVEHRHNVRANHVASGASAHHSD